MTAINDSSVSICSAASNESGLEHLVMPQDERDHLLAHSATLSQLCLHELFEQQVERSPEALALVHDDLDISYAELNARANRLAHYLRGAGVGPNQLVVVALGRSADLVIAELAILKAGAAYLPLDPAWPMAHQAWMIDDCNAKLVLTAPATQVPSSLIRIDMDQPGIAACASTNLAALGNGRTLAYVMYTSGSTGKPKGVLVPHQAVARLVIENGYADFGPAERIAFAANPAFDASTLEIWAALLNGGAVVVIEPHILLEPERLAHTLAQQAVTVLWLTVGLFNQYAGALGPVFGQLRYLIVGGDVLDPKVIKQVLRDNRPQHLLNGYGPTETTTFATTYEINAVADDAKSIPIGRPIAHTQIYILDRQRNVVPMGMEGEIYIGGAGVALGYLNRPQLTAERFLPDPFSPIPGARMYKTGDLGRWRADANIDYLGRDDFQVKIRGFRIELGEIEARLGACPGVAGAAVLALPDPSGDKRLVAYVVPDQPGVLAVSEVRRTLAMQLADYMVPSAFVLLDRLPLTPNGKLDRASLPAPGQNRPELAQPYLAPVGREESVMCALFAEQLGIDHVGRMDNFFELGGNSLGATRLVLSIKQATGRALTAARLFNQPTPAGVVAALRQGADGVCAAPVAPGRRSQSNGRDDIAIIAMSGRFPGAADVDALWRILDCGLDTITVFTDEQLDLSIGPELRNDPAYVKARAVLDDVDMFDAAFFGITPREAEIMDPQQRIFLELCWDCLERGGHGPAALPMHVGVFGGMFVGSYLQKHVRPDLEACGRAGELAIMLANEKDYIATRVAHRLNLTGPAVSIHTACSTSLVAVVQAVTSLRAGQCAMALAGGVSITCPPRSGYLYQEGAILSPDGHTRTFDADAGGTVFGDGAAVLLLKRHADALADGDPIIALIRGVAINNDGGAKASFTAPSVDGQAAVIAAALDDAGVNARAISYVEAHGTATPIGDPIEIEALTRAYRRHTTDSSYCRIGSIKSNLGHLIAAGGAAGLIKTALSLQHEKLPATLHYRTPNPNIDFARTPFVVNASATPWPRSAQPRMAGVSAFGFGGTNAHVIVEEAPARPASEPASGAQLLLLSARTAESLSGNGARLAGHLEAHPESNLADVAYTLRVGRKAMAERLCIVADDVAQAIDLLRAESSPFKSLGNSGQRTPDVVFMFPGQSAQYAAMGRTLYAEEPAFRTAFDACVAALEGWVEFDLKALLYGPDAALLTATETTQPALFCIEYALARYWIELGLQPVALLGHSVGEFVAATIAGVFTLADGVRLVAKRGQLMQTLAPGAMLAVRQGAAQLGLRLPENVSLAAANSPFMSVVAGPFELIEQFRCTLDSEGISARMLQTSHAFHSAMMDPAVASFELEVRKCTLAPPRVPIYSTVTGKLLKDAEACDPAYWARHLRATVRFSPALVELANSVPALLLEVGPQTTLTTLAFQHAKPGQPFLNAVASLADSAQCELFHLRLATGRLWTLGVDINLDSLDRRSRKMRVTLPGYAFLRRRHWLEAALPAVPGNEIQPAPAPFPSTLELPQEKPMLQAPVQDRTAQLIDQLRNLLENTSGIDLSTASNSASLVELGLDSLTLTQVAIQLKQTFKVNITFRQLMEVHRSLNALALYLDGQLPPTVAAPALPSAMAAAPATPMLVASAPGNLVQHVIEQQMQLMAQQLALLQGTVCAAAVPVAIPAAPGTAALPPPAMPTVGTDPDPGESTGSIKYDVKKAFGAIARIHADSGAGLSARQRARLDGFMHRYIEATKRSKEYTQEHRSHLADPRVVNGFRPMLKEIIYQIVIERSQGSKLWDLDGNEYVDANNGFGMSLFGWQPDFVLQAVKQQLDIGYEIGPQHPLAGAVAKLVCDITGHDRAGLCNTGSEAVMGAMRIARTVTGRNLIVLFSGSYHGIFDEVIVRASKRLRPVPAAPGILPNTTENIIVLDYGTPQALEIMRSRIDDIAAVLIEPVQSRRPEFQPVDFLREVRALTSESGAVLIFDEVITGFRAALGGVQELFGIRADICTYGKVIGGGFPIGVIAGKREFLDALDGGGWQYGDGSAPTVGVTYFAGTFVRHPLALAAAKAALEHLQREGPALQARLNRNAEQLAHSMNAFCREVGAPIEVRQFSSLWKIFFTEDHVLQDLLFAMMRNRGVHIIEHFPCFLTTAHSEQDIARINKAFMEAVTELQDSDFIPRRTNLLVALFDAECPPAPGARLGKDPQGNPGWFLPDARNPGKFLKVEA